MSSLELQRACEAEIRDLHRFFTDWFLAEVPDTDEAWSRVTSALDDAFTLVGPDGVTHARDPLLAAIRARYGCHPSPTDFRIETRDVRILLTDGEGVLVRYEEWQRLDAEERGRVSTAYLRRDPQAPHGLRWCRVHETWLPVRA